MVPEDLLFCAASCEDKFEECFIFLLSKVLQTTGKPEREAEASSRPADPREGPEAERPRLLPRRKAGSTHHRPSQAILGRREIRSEGRRGTTFRWVTKEAGMPGRKLLGERAMTPAERQVRFRTARADGSRGSLSFQISPLFSGCTAKTLAVSTHLSSVKGNRPRRNQRSTAGQRSISCDLLGFKRSGHLFWH